MKIAAGLLLATLGVASAVDCGDGKTEISYKDLEAVVIQDISYSYDKFLPNMKRNIAQLGQDLKQDFKGKSRTGLVSFADKAMAPYGSGRQNECYNRRSSLSENPNDLSAAASSLGPLPSGDYPESSFEAMINAATDPAMGWSAGSTDVLKLLIVITDDRGHVAGDAAQLGPHVVDGVARCENEDYPSLDQLSTVLKNGGFQVIFVTVDKYVSYFQQTLATLGVQGKVTTTLMNGSDFVKSIKDQIEIIKCEEPPTLPPTTPPPTTPMPRTTPTPPPTTATPKKTLPAKCYQKPKL